MQQAPNLVDRHLRLWTGYLRRYEALLVSRLRSARYKHSPDGLMGVVSAATRRALNFILPLFVLLYPSSSSWSTAPAPSSGRSSTICRLGP